MTSFEETLRPRRVIRLFGSDRLRYLVDEAGLSVEYGDPGADPSSSLSVPAGSIRGASVVWTRQAGYDPRETPLRTVAIVRWLYYRLPYAEPIDAVVEVRTDDGPELFGTNRPEEFLAALRAVVDGGS